MEKFAFLEFLDAAIMSHRRSGSYLAERRHSESIGLKKAFPQKFGMVVS
jgi:hypothetical protein